MKSEIPGIPIADLERAQARVDELLNALRGQTARLGPEADSALEYRPDAGKAAEPAE